jgi:hypothetical protein
MPILGISGSIVVEHLPHYSKVWGSSAAAVSKKCSATNNRTCKITEASVVFVYNEYIFLSVI